MVNEDSNHDVLVLCGGLSTERDVSLRSGRRVAEALRDQGLAVTTSDLGSGLLNRLTERPPACVVPMLHGAAGEDGSLADLLTTLGLPFVGSTADANRLAFDKPVAKSVARHCGVSTPDAVALPHAMFRELGADMLLSRVVDRLGLPLIVKPTKGGSALGAAEVNDASELPAAMVGAYAYGEVALIERLISGTMVSVGVVEDAGGPRTLPAIEIVPDSGFYDYTARYTAGTTEFFAPARLSDSQAETAAQLALSIHEHLGLRDFSRVDMIIDNDRTWFIKANVAPGMTETSLMPQAIEADGKNLGTFFADLVAVATARAS
jgi:D-alanine-D-alanine ligase